MSAENVEIAEGAVDAFNRHDSDAFADLTTTDFEWFPAMTSALGTVSYGGREGVERFFEALDDTWEEFRAVVEEFRDLGDRVLILVRLEGRGRGSGVPVAAPQGVICHFRGGRIWRVRSYLDQDEALRAAGLFE